MMGAKEKVHTHMYTHIVPLMDPGLVSLSCVFPVFCAVFATLIWWQNGGGGGGRGRAVCIYACVHTYVMFAKISTSAI